MLHNQMWIVSDTQTQPLAYYIKNELQQWHLVSNDSDLSRKEYTHTTMQTRAEDIVRVIDTIYNRGNRGVDILFEGDEADFLFLKKAVDQCPPQSGITCTMPKTRIVVAGKVGAGKTTLIEGVGNYRGTVFSSHKENENIVYASAKSTIIWYEIPSIDVGSGHIDRVKTTIEDLMAYRIAAFVYCLGSARIEPVEEQLLFYIRDRYPALRLLIALTQSVDDEQALYAEQLSGLLGGIRVIPVLAIDKNTQCGTIAAYGLDDMERCLFGG